MSVYIETSAGDIVVDLYVDECPMASKNFIKLCKYVFNRSDSPRSRLYSEQVAGNSCWSFTLLPDQSRATLSAG
jgi:cyclophilin family peptidyl-prolyl cis-trans isomerase